jgi:hypothetical protein
MLRIRIVLCAIRLVSVELQKYPPPQQTIVLSQMLCARVVTRLLKIVYDFDLRREIILLSTIQQF